MAKRRSIKTELEPDVTISAEVTLEALTRDARAVQLDVFGTLHDGTDTIVLLGPHEPGFWQVFSESPEYSTNRPNPLDTWSKRVVDGLAMHWNGAAIFPSDGPPYPPFFEWALKSGRAWKSPVSLLVHDVAGLWVSYRGAVRISGYVDLPSAPVRPCDDCAAPCMSACPVNALDDDGYDVATCKSHLNGADSGRCMAQGCAVRCSCPISGTYGRLTVQSSFHMRAFNPS